MSRDPATPKNDCVKDPGVSATRSSMWVMLTLSSISALIEVSDRGVSMMVLPNPNTDSFGCVGRTCSLSAVICTVSKELLASAVASCAVGPSAANSSCGVPTPPPSVKKQSVRAPRAAQDRVIIVLPDSEIVRVKLYGSDPLRRHNLGGSGVQESCAPHMGERARPEPGRARLPANAPAAFRNRRMLLIQM